MTYILVHGSTSKEGVSGVGVTETYTDKKAAVVAYHNRVALLVNTDYMQVFAVLIDSTGRIVDKYFANLLEMAGSNEQQD